MRRVSHPPLSGRELQVLRLLADGLCTSEMGRILSLSPKTIESHRASISRKLETSRVALLTRWAIRQGLIDP